MRYAVHPHARCRMGLRQVTDAEIDLVTTAPDDVVADPLTGRDGYIAPVQRRAA